MKTWQRMGETLEVVRGSLFFVGRLVVAIVLAVFIASCAKPLPDADSAGAKAYRARCSGCHVLFHPALLTAEMWKTQVKLMEEGEFRRRGLKLSPQERELIVQYLTTYAGGTLAQRASAQRLDLCSRFRCV